MTRNEAIAILGEYGSRFLKSDAGMNAADKAARKQFLSALLELRGKEQCTRKPCPGCGKSSTYATRRTDEVCHECRKKLDDYDALIKARDRKEKECEYEFPSVPHGWPYIHWAGQLDHDKDDCDPNHGFRDLLWRLASLLGRPTVPGWQRPNGRSADETVNKLPRLYAIKKISAGDGSWYDHTNIRLLTADEAEVIDALDTTARKMIEAVYRQGVADGQDLLRQLADGTLTAADFNKEALRRQGKNR